MTRAASLTRRDRERQETRNLILDAAREMFARDGYEAVSMRAIAKRIEYTPTAIYHHFKDKDALFLELCRHDFRALAGSFLRVGRIEDPVQRLLRIGEAYVDFALEHPQQYRFLFLTKHPDDVEHPEKDNPEEDAYGFLRQTVSECIASGRFRPEYGDVDRVAQLSWASCHGVVALHVFFEGDEWVNWQEPRETARLMMAAQVRGMLK
jgi:AcrR family transcriptional regulator